MLTRSHDLTRVVLYGPDGKIASSWGRKGRGPGEVTQIERVSWLTADWLLVLDPGNRRLSIWLRDSTLVRELSSFVTTVMSSSDSMVARTFIDGLRRAEWRDRRFWSGHRKARPSSSLARFGLRPLTDMFRS